MKKTIVKAMVIVFIFIIIGGSINPDISSSASEKSDVSYINYDDFDSKIENFMEIGHFPSLVACIVKNDEIVWSKGYGYADRSILHKRKAI